MNGPAKGCGNPVLGETYDAPMKPPSMSLQVFLPRLSFDLVASLCPWTQIREESTGFGFFA